MEKRLLAILLPSRKEFREATLKGTLDHARINALFREKGYESEVLVVDPHDRDFSDDRYTGRSGQLNRLRRGYFTELVLFGSEIHSVVFEALAGLPGKVVVKNGASPGTTLDQYLRFFARDKIGQARPA